MAKPKARGNATLKRIWFAGAPNQGGAKAPHSLELSGPTPLSRSLRLSDPGFSGCRWPLGGAGADQLYCCAPVTTRFCAVHAKSGVVPIPETGRGSVAEFIRGLERFL